MRSLKKMAMKWSVRSHVAEGTRDRGMNHVAGNLAPPVDSSELLNAIEISPGKVSDKDSKHTPKRRVSSTKSAMKQKKRRPIIQKLDVSRPREASHETVQPTNRSPPTTSSSRKCHPPKRRRSKKTHVEALLTAKEKRMRHEPPAKTRSAAELNATTSVAEVAGNDCDCENHCSTSFICTMSTTPSRSATDSNTLCSRENRTQKDFPFLQSVGTASERMHGNAAVVPVTEKATHKQDKGSQQATPAVRDHERITLTNACPLKAICHAREVNMGNSVLVARGPLASGLGTQSPLQKDYVNCSMSIDARVANREEWLALAAGPHEMVIGCAPRQISPPLIVRVLGLEEDSLYTAALVFVPLGVCYLRGRGIWSESKNVFGDNQTAPEYLHHFGQRRGTAWMFRPIYFRHLRLTSPPSSKPSQVALERNQMYQPVLQFRCMKHAASVNVIFPELRFIAVCAYQNPQMEILKARYRKKYKVLTDPLHHKTARGPSISTARIPQPLSNSVRVMQNNLAEESVENPGGLHPGRERPHQDTGPADEDTRVQARQRKLSSLDVSVAVSAGARYSLKEADEFLNETYERLKLDKAENSACCAPQRVDSYFYRLADVGGSPTSAYELVPKKLCEEPACAGCGDELTGATPLDASSPVAQGDFPTTRDFFTSLATAPVQDIAYFDSTGVNLGDGLLNASISRQTQAYLDRAENVDGTPISATKDDLQTIFDHPTYQALRDAEAGFQLDNSISATSNASTLSDDNLTLNTPRISNTSSENDSTQEVTSDF
ncbi:uncharacterized protein LOC135393351 isoform X1 [Ornithodoros turicata]|uniref:uncharacterized protein LOC135393351 isoform X1 n=1 Tax=Ornithodoros turicata TaxID=34597 RepID=UPI0031395BF6